MGVISKEEFIAGTVAGWAQVLSGQPFDNTKFRMQGASTNIGLSATLKAMMAEGPFTFYKGMLSPFIGFGMAVSIQFGVFQTVKKYLASHYTADNKPTLTHSFIGGVMAGIANTCVITPAEHIRIKVSVPNSPKERKLIHCQQKNLPDQQKPSRKFLRDTG